MFKLVSDNAEKISSQLSEPSEICENQDAKSMSLNSGLFSCSQDPIEQEENSNEEPDLTSGPLNLQAVEEILKRHSAKRQLWAQQPPTNEIDAFGHGLHQKSMSFGRKEDLFSSHHDYSRPMRWEDLSISQKDLEENQGDSVQRIKKYDSPGDKQHIKPIGNQNSVLDTPELDLESPENVAEHIMKKFDAPSPIAEEAISWEESPKERNKECKIDL